MVCSSTNVDFRKVHMSAAPFRRSKKKGGFPILNDEPPVAFESTVKNIIWIRGRGGGEGAINWFLRVRSKVAYTRQNLIFCQWTNTGTMKKTILLRIVLSKTRLVWDCFSDISSILWCSDAILWHYGGIQLSFCFCKHFLFAFKRLRSRSSVVFGRRSISPRCYSMKL